MNFFRSEKHVESIFTKWNLCFLKFLKNRKVDAQSHVFPSNIVTWASQVRLFLWFVSFWCDANSFLPFSIGPKSIRNRSLEQLGVAQAALTHGFRRSGAANYQRNRCIDNKNHEVRDLTRRWVVGPATVLCDSKDSCGESETASNHERHCDYPLLVEWMGPVRY